MNETISKLTKVAVPAGIAWAIYKFVDNTQVKTAALGVMAVVIAKQLPIIGNAL